MSSHDDRRGDVIDVLNGLIETCKDGQEGFQTAAESIEDPELGQLLHEYAQERAAFAAELQTAVRRLGGDPELKGTVGGALHRGWMNVKSTMTGQDAAAIFGAAETGEDSARQSYEEALATDLPADVRTMVDRQYLAVREAHDTVRMIRDRRRAA
jgi:uncharacterized protein (TIGR02284 family)